MDKESQIYVAGFKITSFPANPLAINEQAPPPPVETVGQTEIGFVDSKSQVFLDWLNNAGNQMAVYKDWVGLNGLIPKAEWEAAVMAAASNNPHISSLYWVDFIKANSNILNPATPPTETVTVVAQFHWKSLGSQYNSTTEVTSWSQATQQGVTNGLSETESFATTISASGTSTFEAISATLSASFTKTSSTTHSITVSKETSYTETVPVAAGQYVQVWQLFMTFTAGGITLTSGTQNWQTLSPQSES